MFRMFENLGSCWDVIANAKYKIKIESQFELEICIERDIEIPKLTGVLQKSESKLYCV